MRSFLRWLARVVAGVVALAVLAIAVALVLAHTSWGRERLRASIERALHDGFPGGARVGRLDGSLLGTVTLHGVELDGADRTPRVTIGTLHLALALWPLVNQTARFDRVVAEDVLVVVRREPPGPPQPPSPPSPWRVELPHIELHRATVEIDPAGVRQRLVALDAAGFATVDRGRVALFGWSYGRWQDRGALAAAAVVEIDDAVRVSAAKASLGEATISATRVLLDADHPSGTLELHAPGRALAQLLPELVGPELAGALGELHLTATAQAASPSSTRLELDASAGGARLWASLEGEPARRTARGVISAAGIDLALATGGRLCGRGDLLAAVEAACADAHQPCWAAGDHLRGTLLVHGDVLDALGRLRAPSGPGAACPAPPAAQDALVALDARSSHASALVLGRGEGWQVHAIAEARRDGAGAISLDSARATATASALAVGDQRVTGKLVVDASARGTLSPALGVQVTGTAAGDAVALDDTAIAQLRGPFALRVGADPLAEAHLTARGVRTGPTSIGTIRADVSSRLDGRYRVAATARPRQGVEIFADADVAARDAGIVARLLRSRVTLPGGATWTGRDGEIIVGDTRIALRGATLHAGDAALALRGTLARQTGALDVHVEADRLPASAIDARYRGLAGATVSLARRGGRWSGDARLALRGFAIAPSGPAIAPDAHGEPAAGEPALDATAHAALTGRRASLELRAGTPDHGVELAFEATPPRDPFDGRAWRRLDRTAIHNATLTVHQLALAQLAGLGGARGTPTGTIDGTVNLAPGDLHGAFTLRGIELPFATAGGELTFAPEDGDLGVRATAQLPELADAVAQVRLALPQRPFDPASWQRGGRDLVRDGSARLDNLVLDDAPSRRRFVQWLADHGVAPPVHGHARLALTVGAAARDARVAIDLDAAGGPLVAPVASRIDVTTGARGTHVRAALRAGGERALELGVLDGDLPVTLERWLTQPAAALQSPVVAQWTLPTTPAAPLLALLGRRDIMAGTLEGRGGIRGSLATPIVDAHLVARDLAVAPRVGGRPPPVFHQLDLDAAWSGASGHVEIHGEQAGGGTLQASASGRPDRLAAVTGSLTSRHLDIAPITAVFPSTAPGTAGALAALAGTVDADLALHAGPRLTGTLELTGGAVPIASAIGTVRDATAHVEIDERTVTAKLDGKLAGGTVHLDARAPDDLGMVTATLRLDRVAPVIPLRPIITATLEATLQLGAARCREAGDSAHVCGQVTVAPDAHVVFPDQPDIPLLDPDLPNDLVLVDAAQPARPGSRLASLPWLVAHVDLRKVLVEARDDAEGSGFRATMCTHERCLDDDRQVDRAASGLVVSLADTVGVRGKVTIDTADADILDRRYQVDRSALSFDGTIDPELDLHLSHAFPELTLFVDVTGRASNPKPQFSSDSPAYSSDQLFGFFLGGEPSGDPGLHGREALTGGVSRLVSGQVGRRLGKELPIRIDTVSCEPATSATAATGGSCTFGRWLSQRLYVAYRQHLGQAAPDENTGDVQVQYRLGRKTVIEVIGGDRGHYGTDLLWRHRW